MEALEFAQEELAPRGEENVSGFRFHVHCHSLLWSFLRSIS